MFSDIYELLLNAFNGLSFGFQFAITGALVVLAAAGIFRATAAIIALRRDK